MALDLNYDGLKPTRAQQHAADREHVKLGYTSDVQVSEVKSSEEAAAGLGDRGM